MRAGIEELLQIGRSPDPGGIGVIVEKVHVDTDVQIEMSAALFL